MAQSSFDILLSLFENSSSVFAGNIFKGLESFKVDKHYFNYEFEYNNAIKMPIFTDPNPIDPKFVQNGPFNSTTGLLASLENDFYPKIKEGEYSQYGNDDILLSSDKIQLIANPLNLKQKLPFLLSDKAFIQVGNLSTTLGETVFEHTFSYSNDLSQAKSYRISRSSPPHKSIEKLTLFNTNGSIHIFNISSSLLDLSKYIFSEPSIFLKELSEANWINQDDNNTLVNGDFYFDKLSGSLYLYHTHTNLSYGYITLYYSPSDYIEFSEWPIEEISNLKIGISDGTIKQAFYFNGPFLDNDLAFDNALIVEDSLGNVYTRVDDILAKDENGNYVYSPTDHIFSADINSIHFGYGGYEDDNAVPMPGAIPPYNESVFLSYNKTSLIEYKPEFASETFSDANLTLDPLTKFQDRGFLFLDNELPNPYYLFLYPVFDFYSEDSYGFGPKVIGQDIIYIKALLLDKYKNPVSNWPINWFKSNQEIGTFDQLETITNNKGESVNGLSLVLSSDGIGTFMPIFYEAVNTLEWNHDSASPPVSLLGEEINNIGDSLAKLVVNKRINGASFNNNIRSGIFLYYVYADSNYHFYNPFNASGGRRIIASKDGFPLTVISAEEDINQTILEFDDDLQIRNTSPVSENVTFTKSSWSPFWFSADAELQKDYVFEHNLLNIRIEEIQENDNGDVYYRLNTPIDALSFTTNVYDHTYSLVGYLVVTANETCDIWATALNREEYLLKSNTLTYALEVSDIYQGEFALGPNVKNTQTMFMSPFNYLTLNAPINMAFVDFNPSINTVPNIGGEYSIECTNFPDGFFNTNSVPVIILQGNQMTTVVGERSDNQVTFTIPQLPESFTTTFTEDPVTCYVGVVSLMSKIQALEFKQERS